MLGERYISISMVVSLVFIGFLFPSHSLSDINNTVLLGEQFLEEGFPIFVPLQAGVSVYDYMKVANIDSDDELEIIFKPLNNELCAWNHDGIVVSGWPLPNTYVDGGFVLGEFDKDMPGLEIFYGHESTYGTPASVAIYSGSGSPINGWPCLDYDCRNLLTFYSPTATDLDE